jgi:hypothetical protein
MAAQTYGFVDGLDSAQKRLASEIATQHIHVREVAIQIRLAIDCNDAPAARDFAIALEHQLGGLADDEIAPQSAEESSS